MAYYIKKDEFLKVIEDYLENPNEKNCELLSEKFMKIIEGFINKKKYHLYMDRNELIMESYVACMESVHKFDKNKDSKFKEGRVNPFSFFNMVARNTMINMLKDKDRRKSRTILADFNQKVNGNITFYDELSFYNETVREKENNQLKTSHLKFIEMIEYLETKREIFQKKDSEVVNEIFEEFILSLKENLDFDEEFFKKHIKNDKPHIRDKDIKIFFEKLADYSSFEKLNDMI